MMMKIPVFMPQVQPDKKCTVSQPLEFSQLDTIQIKKGLAHCNVHNKNNQFYLLEMEITRLNFYLAIIFLSNIVFDNYQQLEYLRS